MNPATEAVLADNHRQLITYSDPDCAVRIYRREGRTWQLVRQVNDIHSLSAATDLLKEGQIR